MFRARRGEEGGLCRRLLDRLVMRQERRSGEDRRNLSVRLSKHVIQMIMQKMCNKRRSRRRMLPSTACECHPTFFP